MHASTLHALLSDAAGRFPGRDAVAGPTGSLTYASLDSLSSRFAAALQERAVMPGDRVGIALNKSAEAIVSVFAVLKAGAVYVPIDPLSPAERINRLLRACDVRCLITSAVHAGYIRAGLDADTPVRHLIVSGMDAAEPTDAPEAIETAGWEHLMKEFRGRVNRPVSRDGADPAYILHTSGSTGVPKGVVISHRNALAFVAAAAGFFDIRPEDRIANHAPLHFDLSVFDIFCAVAAGAAIVPVPEYLNTFAGRLAEFIADQRITVWNSVSSILAMMAERGRIERLDFSRLRLVHFSGDVMPVKYLRILKAHMKNAVFYNIYGQTEANSSLCYRVDSLPESDDKKIPIGKPLPGFDVFALGADGAAAGPGEEGELYVSSPTVALGYWGDPGRTAEKFVPDPRSPESGSFAYRTGDLVRIDRDGNFLFTGRKDHQVKSRGYRIELGEIEVVLNSHPAVKQGVALALPDELIGNRIIAIVALGDGAAVLPDDLVDFCCAKLPSYMVPESIICRKSMPVTTTGKIDRTSLAGLPLFADGGEQEPQKPV